MVPALYAIFTDADLDPAMALAFAKKEHSLRWEGVAAHTLGWGNVVKAATDALPHSRSTGAYGRFAAYDSIVDGAADWCAYMHHRYLDRGITDLDAILRLYAPASDGNDPTGYAATVRRLVAQWQREDAFLAPATTDRRMVVREAARLRTAPNRQSDIIRTLPAGLVVSVDHIIADGEAVEGSRRWAALTTGGYVWAGLLREVLS
jgi:hypothetical protein